MNIKYLVIFFAFSSLIFSASSHANKAVNDDFATDGTAVTDAAYFGSSSASAIEINTNSIGLVSGSSGRQIHALFATQTLANAGDMLKASITFTTPNTIATTNEELRIGLFDHLERTGVDELGQNTSYSSSTSTPGPNPLYEGLPGFFLELDVETADPATDLEIRKSNPSTSGRLLATTSGFTALGSGPNIGYAIAANTEYNVILTMVRTGAGALNITADFLEESYTAIDVAPNFNFGMLALSSSGGAFGSSNTVGDADNGIEINKFTVELIPFGPVSGGDDKAVDDDFVANGTSTSDASYFGSSASSAIETNPNSIGLVSGASGRQIHALFDTQTLANAGDALNASVTFTTPATVATTNEDLRIGLFDHLERVLASELGKNTSYNSSNPNADYSGLPGFYLELDVESSAANTDLDIRKSNPSTSGRLLADSGSTHFTAFGSGPDIGYSIVANTEYTVDFSIVRTETDTLNISANFLGEFVTVVDDAPLSFNFGMLAMSSSSGAFGSSNTGGAPDNGIDISKFSVELVPFVPVEVNDPSKIVDDNFLNDGSVDTDADYYTSSNSNAIEFNSDSIGIVSGSSGRAIHALFETQTLSQSGDILRAGITFTTPATVTDSGGEDIRLGLFDHLGRNTPTELAQNTIYSSTVTNPVFSGLPGFYLDLDVESASPQSDLDIRKSNPTTSGRLLGTTSGFTALGNGPDLGYVFEPNTEYTVYFTIERTANDQLDINANFLGRSFTVTDAAPLSFDFGMLAFNISGGAFGSSNSPGDDDNGIDLTNVSIEFIRTSAVADDFSGSDPAAANDRYFGSSSASAIEFNDDSIGLVSGASGRQIHTLFDTKTLANSGDVLEALITFTTPASVASTNEELRIGIFDHLDRTSDTQLGQNTSFNSDNPNNDYSGLPGFYLELDVEASDPATNLEVRRSDPSTSGRLLTTTSGFSTLPDSDGPSIGYSITANTTYTASFKIERTEADRLSITTDFLGESLTVTDASPASFDFGMLAFYASSGAVGTSNTAGEVDNGIDISSVVVTVSPFFSPPEIVIPPVEPPIGDHPDVEIIPTVPEDNTGTEVVVVPPIGGNPTPGTHSGNPIAAVISIVSLLLLDDEDQVTAELTEAQKVAQYFGLNPNVGPWQNFDLSDWGLDTPNVDITDGFSARTNEDDLAVGNLFPGAEPFFFTGSDGAMVFKSIVGGARTSLNTSYPRSELREMLRAGDTTIGTQGVNANNWALDHQPENPNIAARGGKLSATLSIDQVTTTGNSSQLGRVIIGQIHASKDEPIRLYYRKVPGNTKGVIYAAHELNNDGGDDVYFEMIGQRANSAPEPENGIALGELFSYEINNVGALIEVTIRRGDRDGPIIETLTINMDTVIPGGSGYDLVDEWMYFKAGAYSQNNSGWANDFDQVRFYRLENSH